jgi:hypothetical protein
MGDRRAAWVLLVRPQRGTGLWPQRLAEIVGAALPYLLPIERGLHHPRDEIFHQAAGALRASAKTLYRQAGTLDRRQRGQAEAAIVADPTISPRQQQVLIDIYETFRGQHRTSSCGTARDLSSSASTRRTGREGAPDRDDADGQEGQAAVRTPRSRRPRGSRRTVRAGVEAVGVGIGQGRTPGGGRGSARTEAAPRGVAVAGGRARAGRLPMAGSAALRGVGHADDMPGAPVGKPSSVASGDPGGWIARWRRSPLQRCGRRRERSEPPPGLHAAVPKRHFPTKMHPEIPGTGPWEGASG